MNSSLCSSSSDRLPIIDRARDNSARRGRVIRLAKTRSPHSRARSNARLAELDGATLFADHEMMIASERGVSRAALLVSEARENGVELIQGAQDSIGLRSSAAARCAARSEDPRPASRVSRVSGNFLQDRQRALEKARSIDVCVKRVRLEARPLQVLERLVPDRASFRVIGQPFDVLVEPSGGERFERVGRRAHAGSPFALAAGSRMRPRASSSA